MSWYQKGNEGRTKSKQEDAASAKRREHSGVNRFWQGNDEECKIICLDTPEFFYHEHNLWKLTGNFDYETCIKDSDEAPCPLDEIGRPAYSLAGTIIDTREIDSKKEPGKVYKNQKRLLVLKGKARENFLRESEAQGHDLKFAVFTVARGAGKNESGTGEYFKFLGKVTAEKLAKLLPEGEKFAEWVKPFDYPKILAPKSAAQLRKLTGASAPVGSDDDLLDDLETDSPVDDGNVDNIDDLL